MPAPKQYVSGTKYGYVLQLGDEVNGAKQFQSLVTMDMPAGKMTDVKDTSYGVTVRYKEFIDGLTVQRNILYRLPLPGVLALSDPTKEAYDKAPKMIYTWKSKKFVMAGQTVIGAARVVRDCGGSCSLSIYIDCRLAWTTNVCDSKPFTTPSDLMGLNIEIELTGTARVRKVQLASSINDLLDSR